MSEQTIDHDWNDYPVCPHCGYKHTDWMCADEGEEENVDCESCGELMDVQTHVQINYSTEKSPPRCKECKGEKDRPRQVGFKPEGGALYCDDDFHEGAVR